MTIGYVGESSYVSQVGDSSPATLTWPSVSAGDKAVLLVFTGNDTNGTVTTPSGFTLVGTGVGGAGTWGGGTGPRRVTAFELDCAGSETGTFNVAWVSTGGGAVFAAQLHIFSKTAGAWAATAFATGAQATDVSGSAAYVVTTGTISLAAGDMAIGFGAANSDSVLGSAVYAASGITFGTVTERETQGIAGGSRGVVHISTGLVSSGSGTVAASLTLDLFGDAASGPGMFVRLRESAGGGSSIAAISNYYRMMRAA